MKPGYSKYYEKHSPLAPIAFVAASLFTRSKARKLALLNRQRDYMALANQEERLELHRRLNQELLESADSWDSYDYGEGYFYQGLAAIGVTGLRDTGARVEQMQLLDRLAGSSVLEIGCNTGFVALAVAGSARNVVGFDINPHLIRIGRVAADHLGVTNVDLEVSSFEDFAPRAFDVVLSFANHSTYDENTRQSLEDYFERCRACLQRGGQLLFESHPPEHEGKGLERVKALIRELFEVEEERVLTAGTYLDRNRTFISARRRE